MTVTTGYNKFDSELDANAAWLTAWQVVAEVLSIVSIFQPLLIC